MTQAVVVPVQEESIDPLIADLNQQLREQIGNEPVTKEEESILRQKFGLMATQLTLSERNLISREERNAGRRR